MLILLSNDDGIHSEGILYLNELLSKKFEVYVVAPEKERTCISHAVTIHKPLRIKKVHSKVYCTNGTPADCIFLALNKILPRWPDFIISGINKGPNMGQDVHYSGTIAAAKEGAFMGIPSMAVSISAREDFYFKDAAMVVERLLNLCKGIDKDFFKNMFLNVNVPNLPFDKIKGFLVTRLGKRIYNDTVTERIDPRGNKYYWIGGNGDAFERIDGSDFMAVEKGFVSITPIALDITNNFYIDELKKIFGRFT